MPNVNSGPASTSTANVQSSLSGPTSLLANLPPASSVTFGTQTYTSDAGPVYSNGMQWVLGYLIARKKHTLIAPGIKNIQQVMASPPTLAISTTNPAAAGQFYGATNLTTGSLSAPINTANWTVTRAGNPVIQGAAFPALQYVGYNSILSAGGSNIVDFSVIFSGTVLVFAIKDLNTSMLVKVNDQYVSLTPTATGSTGSTTYLSITFQAAVTGVRIDILCSDIFGAMSFWGMYTGSLTDTLEPAEIRGPRIIVLGDSITAATGAAHQALGFVGVFAEYLGWDDVWPSGIGGTGMLTAASQAYIARLATDVFPYAPDEVIIAGFQNDNGQKTSDIAAAASALIAAIHQNLPTCRITFFGPYTPIGSGYQFGNNAPNGTGYVATRAGLAQATANDPLVRWIDPTTYPLNASSNIPLGATQQANNTHSLTQSVVALATTLHTNIALLTGAQYEFADGSRFRTLSIANTTATIDQCINAQANGATFKLVGNCWITGVGFQGALTGVGNADTFIFTDHVHPVSLGHRHLGIALAQQYVANLNS